MADDPTKEEAQQRETETLRRLLETPPQPKAKPKPAREAPERASKPEKRGPVGEAS